MTVAEEPLFKQMYQAVGGNTLVIEVMAKNLSLFHQIKQHYSLALLVADLDTKGLLALSKSQAVTVGYQAKDVLRQEKPEDIIAAMYDLSERSRAETALLSVFAVLPNIPPSYRDSQAAGRFAGTLAVFSTGLG